MDPQILQRALRGEPMPKKPAPGFSGWVMSTLHLYDIPADKDGLYDGALLPKEQYSFIWRLSWAPIVGVVPLLFNGHYDLLWCPLLICFTSLNYWRRPKRDWRRTLDVGCVQGVLWYQVWRAYTAENGVAYYILTGMGVMSYGATVYYEHVLRLTWMSTLCHCCVHLTANLANIVLYSGSNQIVQT